MSRRNFILAMLLFAAVVFLSGGRGQLLYSLLSLSLLILLCVTAFPLSRILFPDRAAARLFTVPIGYVIHAVLLSAAGRFFGIQAVTIIVYCCVAIPAFILLSRRKQSAAADEATWREPDTFLLLLWLLMTVLLVALPFWNVGILTGQGYAYRAYFNADFFRNMSVTGALSSTGIPPDNPYVSGFVLSYYWFFHVIPAFWQQILPGYRLDFLLVQFSLFSACAFVACLFAVVRQFTAHRRTLVWLFPLFAFGGSYEGLFILKKLGNRGLPWTAFTQWNVDGILRWLWNAPQIDTLYRALLYAPQHLLALCVVLILISSWGRNKTLAAWLILFFLVFGSVGFSAFVGAALVITCAALMLYQAAREPRATLPSLIIGGLLGLLFLGAYFRLFQMFQPSGGLLMVGPDPVILKNPAGFFILGWGALLPLGLAGIAFSNGRMPVRILSFFLFFCFLLIVFTKLNLPGGSDISLKMGHFSHVMLLLLASGLIDRLLGGAKPWSAIALVAVLVLPASLTWWMDAVNSRDISNAKFTTFVQPQDMTVYNWMRANLPGKARIQNFAKSETSFLRGFVSEIPAFAQRPLYLGDRNFSRIFQVPQDEVDRRRRIVSQLINEQSPEQLWKRSRELGIEYYYWGSHDSVDLPDATRKLVEPYFSVIVQENNAFLFRVNPLQ